jgi:predicted transcriptional regulator
MSVEPLDSLLAIKIIGLMPDLRPSDRRVATLIIEHYRRRDGRCDPGIERLSTLLGLSRRTVFRSVKRLEVAGLIKRIRHGGYSHRNKYAPNWNRLAELSTAWNERLQFAAKLRAANLSRSERHSSHIKYDSSVTQTYKANRPSQTYRDFRGSKNRSAPKATGELQVATPISSDDAVATAAERSWTNALQRQFGSMPITYGEIVEAINPTMQAAATQAEMRNPGAGFYYIVRQLKLGAIKC